jgi:hypothetical protein
MIEFKIKGIKFKAENIELRGDNITTRNIIGSSYSNAYFYDESSKRDIQNMKQSYLKANQFDLSFYKNSVPIKIYGKEYKINHIKVQPAYNYQAGEYDLNKAVVYAFSEGGHHVTAKANQLFEEELQRINILAKLFQLKPYIARNKLKSNLLSVNKDLKRAIKVIEQASEWLEKYQAEIDQELALIV